MGVKIEARQGRLAYRLSMDGDQWREATALRDTPRNRERLQRKCDAMNDLMDEGRFAYLTYFPNGNRAARFQPPAAPTALTVKDYSEATWVPRNQPPHVRLSLAKTRAKHLKHILPVFGATRLDAITEADLEDFKTFLTGKGLKLKTARCILDSTFRALYRDARTIDYRRAFGVSRPVALDPFAVVTWKREMTPEPDPFPEDERDALLAYFWSSRKRHYYAFVAMLFGTGMRIGEAVGLRWGDVDVRRGTFHVRRSRTLGEDNPPKTANADRTKRLQPEVLAVLRAVQPLRATEDTFVFTTEAGTPLDAERFVDKHWRPALRACGLKPRRLYAARHTFISLALAKGVKVKWLAEYTGTSMEMIERHYAKWLDGDDGQLALLTTPSTVASADVA